MRTIGRSHRDWMSRKVKCKGTKSAPRHGCVCLCVCDLVRMLGTRI